MFLTYSNDILGNRTNRNYSTNDASSAYSSWDVLNRMLVYARPSSGASYSYRADGQRIEKVDGPTLQWTQWTRTSGSYDMNYATNRPTSRYSCDGQMGFEAASRRLVALGQLHERSLVCFGRWLRVSHSEEISVGPLAL